MPNPDSIASSWEKQPAPSSQPSRMQRALNEAQQLAFGPVNFMSAYCLRRMGVLDALWQTLGEGLTEEEVSHASGISLYASQVLLESGLAIGAVHRDAASGRYHLSKLGHVLRSDAMTQANFEFIYHVCYQGLFHLEASLRDGRPAGLKTISDAPTVYEGLSQLPPEVKEAWLNFDHFYSDSAFDAALPHVFKRPLRKLLDIGGNTGRFARSCLAYDAGVQVTIADLPQQIVMAKKEQSEALALGRLHFHGCDLLQEDAQLPKGFDAIWMSQFLVCFPEETVQRILQKARAALAPGGRVLILDTFWNRQENPLAAYCLIQTSPYFTTIANGKSRIYRSDTIVDLARQAGLSLESIVDGLGISHSLMSFTQA